MIRTRPHAIAAASLVQKTILRRFLSTSSSSKSILNNKNEMNRLDRISVGLYRILLREIRSIGSDEEDAMKNMTTNDPVILLQPPLEAKEYGRAKIVNAHPSSIRPKTNDSVEKDGLNLAEKRRDSAILSFLLRRIQEKKDHVTKTPKDDSLYSKESDRPILVRKSCLTRAIRTSFVRRTSVSTLSSVLDDYIAGSFEEKELMDVLSKENILAMHRKAIDALKVLKEQVDHYKRTSVSEDVEMGVRVVATSRCIGNVTPGRGGGGLGPSETKYRFAYRIQVENIGRERKSGEGSAVQLLGRTWEIRESTGSGVDDWSLLKGEVVTVRAPDTGAVGHLPVLLPGQVFEYMSGCELATTTGMMGGCFHMAQVDDNTLSAQVGEDVEALSWSKESDERLFLMPVDPFALIADS